MRRGRVAYIPQDELTTDIRRAGAVDRSRRDGSSRCQHWGVKTATADACRFLWSRSLAVSFVGASVHCAVRTGVPGGGAGLSDGHARRSRGDCANAGEKKALRDRARNVARVSAGRTCR